MVEYQWPLIIGILFLLILWLCLRYHFNYWNRRNILYPTPRILTGNLYKGKRQQHFSEICDEIYEKYKSSGQFVGFFLNMQKAVIVLELQLARKVLVHEYSFFESRGFFHNEKDDPLTANLFLLDGQSYTDLKKKILPLFAAVKMKHVFPSVLEIGEQLETVFTIAVARSPDRILDVHCLMGRYTLDVIANCIFGKKVGCLNNPSNQFYIMVRTFFSQRRHLSFIDTLMNCFPAWARYFHMKQIPDDVARYFINIFEQNLSERYRNKVKKSDFMDLFVDLERVRGSFSMNELTALAFSFFITSYDTCMSTLSFVLYELALNQDIQQKVRNEIKESLRGKKNQLTYDCMKAMKYLDQVISETLRKYPVVPALFRKCTKRYTPRNSHFYIEKGTIAVIPTLSFHYDNQYFPNPTRFQPERFCSTNSGNIRQGTYLPYGDGPRKCMGNNFANMIMSVALIKLVKSFRFESCSQTKTPVEIVLPSFNLNPLDIKLKITRI